MTNEDELEESTPGDNGPPSNENVSGRAILTLRLPAASAVLSEARALVVDRGKRIDQVVRALSRDPIAVLEVLRTANSMFFTQDHPPLTTVRSAVIRLGTANLLETLERIGNHPSPTNPEVLATLDILRAKSQRIAKVAELIAQATRREFSDQAYLISLMIYIADIIPCMLLGERFVALNNKCSRPALHYKLAAEYSFRVEANHLEYLRLNGFPESLMFALDRETQTKQIERLPLRFIVEAALELVTASENQRWDRYSPEGELPTTSVLRLLNPTPRQYQELHTKVDRLLHHRVDLEEEVFEATDEAEEGDASLDEEIDVLIASLIPEQLSVPPELSSDSLVPVDHPPLEVCGNEEKNRVQNLDDEIAQVVASVKQQNRTRFYRESSVDLAHQLTAVCSHTENIQQLLQDALRELTGKGLFKRAAILSLSTEEKVARITHSVGDGFLAGASLPLSDPHSPLRTESPIVRSFNTHASDPHAPFGVSSYAISPIHIPGDQSVVIYADCGPMGGMTFECRRLFRYVADLLSRTLSGKENDLAHSDLS